MLDTKQSWDDLVLPARARRGDRVPHPREPAVPQPHRALRAEPRLHRDGAALRDPRDAASTTSSSIDTPPTRNAIDFLDAPKRMAEFFGGRLLRWLTLPYRVGGKRGARVINVASRPFYQMADRILGSKFLQDIAEFFLNFQSMYDGFVERAQGGRAAAARPAHDVRGRHDARGRAAARGRALLRGARRPRLPPRRAGAQQDAARLACSTPARRGRRDAFIDDAGPLADALAETRRPRARRPDAHGAGAAHDRRVVPRTSRSSRCARPSCGPSWPASPTSSSGCPTSSDDISDVDGARRDLRLPLRRGPASAARTMLVSTLDDLALARTRARRARPGAPRAAGRGAGGRSPTSRSPTSCCSRRSRVRRATGSSCSPRCGRSPARRTTRRTSSAPSSTRSSDRCSPRCWRVGEHRRGRHRRARRQGARARAGASPSGATAGSIGARHPRGVDDARRAARASSSAPTSTTFDRFARMIADGIVPVRRRRGRDRERAARRRRRDRDRRRDPREVREPERGELAAPHGHPHVRAVAATWPTSASTTTAARSAMRLPPARSPRRSSATTSRCCVRVLPLVDDDAAGGRARAAPRRQRPPAPRPHAALEGRDDPRDPPPGEEQPADDRVAAAAPGPPAAVARGAGGAGRVGAAHPLDRDRARDACRARRATSCRSTRSCGRWRGSSRTRRRRPTTRSASSVEGDAGELPARWRRRSRSCSTSSCRTRSTTRSPTASPARRRVDVLLAARRRSRRDRGARQRRRACPTEFTLEASRGLGLSIVQALVTASCGARSRCATTTARRYACASRWRCRASSSSAVESGSADAARPPGVDVEALAEPAALVFGECRPRRRLPGWSPSANSRHSPVTGHWPHTRLAASIWSSASAGGADREEELGTGVATGGAVAPVLARPSRASESRSTPLRSPLRVALEGRQARAMCA